MSAINVGSAFPLGVTPYDDGVRIAVHAPAATAVWFCLSADTAATLPGDIAALAEPGNGGELRFRLPIQTYGVWHGQIPGVTPGTAYGLRADGPWDPVGGLRFNPHKLLLDPYARQISGAMTHVAHALNFTGDPFGGPSGTDSAGSVPWAVVAAPLAAAGVPLQTPWERTVIYEAHVSSLTARHPAIPESDRGTYRALGHPALLEHLNNLGVTALELLPVQACTTEPTLLTRKMRNHWGYSTGAFCAPDPRFAAEPGREREEFAGAVAALHDAGIEVLLDVVYNHTAEVGHTGPSLSLRGLDPHGYYRIDAEGHYVDWTGCGNTLNADSPAAVRLVTDSLRLWATEYGVDGFRFDLASVLGRNAEGEFDSRAPLLTAIATDPVLSQRKLIAEPWDATGPGYQVGNFPVQYSEWNDQYRDAARRFWARDHGTRGNLATRVSGSQDLLEKSGRGPQATVNFITAHDGFTLADLVSYSTKHNEANGENNNDGTNNNFAVNHGAEGPTDDPAIAALRLRHRRALLATLAFSVGTPMLLAGDELGHTQHGNNNAYCVPADAPAAEAFALDWDGADPEFLRYVRNLFAFRRASPLLRPRTFFSGHDTESGDPDLAWFGSAGIALSAAEWNDSTEQTLQAFVDGRGTEPDALLILHSGTTPAAVTVGASEEAARTWRVVFDSTDPLGAPIGGYPDPITAGSVLALTGQTVLVLREIRG